MLGGCVVGGRAIAAVAGGRGGAIEPRRRGRVCLLTAEHSQHSPLLDVAARSHRRQPLFQLRRRPPSVGDVRLHLMLVLQYRPPSRSQDSHRTNER